MHAVWIVFSLSFLVALTGAMAPGPLLTYTIAKTLETRKRGFFVGARVIAGHAMLESVLVIVLLLGFAAVLKSAITVRIIGVLGGAFLVYMGIGIVRDIARKRVTVGAGATAGGAGARCSLLFRSAPIVGGAVVSMSNPYWWIWWATVGFAFMIQYNVSFRAWPLLLAFFFGHEAGDLAWYLTVSSLVHVGRERIDGRLYRIVLGACGVLIVLFGVYLGAGPFLKR